jgi:hypothetical protein
MFKVNLRIAMLLAFFLPAGANGQVVSTIAGQTYLAVVGDSSLGGICAGALCVAPQRGISLDNFATSSSVTTQFAGVNSQISTLNTQLSGLAGQVPTINSQIALVNSQISQGFNLIAAVAAMKDAIPAPGDRFAVRFNTRLPMELSLVVSAQAQI